MEMGKGEERQIKHQVVWETEENDQEMEKQVSLGKLKAW